VLHPALRASGLALLLASLAAPGEAGAGGRTLPSAVARKFDLEGWSEIRSPLFEIASDADAARVLQLAQQLSTFIAALELVSNVPDFRPRLPLRIYLFGEQATFDVFSGRRAAGQLRPTPRGLFVLMSPDGLPAREILFHEYVHFLLRNAGGLSYPIWYDEGFAELLAGTRMHRDFITIGSIPELRVDTLRREELLPLEKVLSARSYAEIWDKVHVFYAQSWLLVHYLHAGDQLGYPKRHAQLLSFLAKLSELGDWRAAWDASFDVGPEGLEEELAGYRKRILNGGLLPRLRIDVRRLALELPGAPAPLAPAQVAFELGALFLDGGEDGARYAEKLFERALERDPGHAGALAGLAQAHGLAGDLREAEALVERAIGLAAADPRVLSARGEILFRRFASERENDPEAARALLERAREAYRRAIELAPEGPPGYLGLGKTYLEEEGDVAPGIAALRRACALIQSAQIDLQLGKLHLKAGEPGLARVHLERVLRWSHGDEESEKEARALLAGLPAAAGDRAPAADRCGGAV